MAVPSFNAGFYPWCHFLTPVSTPPFSANSFPWCQLLPSVSALFLVPTLSLSASSFPLCQLLLSVSTPTLGASPFPLCQLLLSVPTPPLSVIVPFFPLTPTISPQCQTLPYVRSSLSANSFNPTYQCQPII